MEDGVVGEPPVGAEPDVLRGGWLALPADRVAVDVAQIDRAWPVVELAELVGVRRHAGLEVGEVLGAAHVLGHCHLVIRSRLVLVEAGLEVEDRPSVLDRHDAAGREAAAVANAIDLVQDGQGRVARAQEIGVEGVHQAGVFGDRAGRGDEGLTGHLAPEHALAVLVG